MTYSTTVTQKGQVTIPATIRRRMKLSPGESVRFRFGRYGQVVIEKNDWQKRLKKLQKEVADHLKKYKIPAVSDAKLDRLINEAARDAALEHNGGWKN